MSNSLIITDKHPTQRFTSITQFGLKALNLATTYKDVLEDRLPGTIDTLTQDLDAFGAAIPTTLQKRNESVASTSAQKARIRQGHARVRAVRQTVRRAKALKEIQHAYGVGRKTAATHRKDVTAALQQIVDRAISAPQEAAGFGLSPKAVAELAAFLETLIEADKAQDQKRASAPLSTKERNTLGNRILQTVALIAGAGMLAFVDNPPTYASFQALLSSPRKTSRKTPEKAPEKSAEPEPPKPSESPAPEASVTAAKTLSA